MILIFLNPSTFARETADRGKANLMSADSWVKIDWFEKFKIMVVRLDLTKEKNEKQYKLLLVFYDFEKLAS